MGADSMLGNDWLVLPEVSLWPIKIAHIPHFA